MNKLEKLWQQQIAYNKKIRARELPDNKEYWTKQYLLGIVSEINEILQEINWKIHRRGHPTNRNNLGRELADLTKYLWCLWELHEFSSNDMLEFIKDKSNELEIQYQQDFNFEIAPGQDIIITDIDGTIGDWRKAFFDWALSKGYKSLNQDAAKTLNIEIDLGISYPEYFRLKEQFESEGGYQSLEPYIDAYLLLERAAYQGAKIIAYTNRPAFTYGRIWSDTWRWIQKNNLPIHELKIGSEQRIMRACRLHKDGHKVTMLEDDPSLALRAAVANIYVLLRDQPYNRGVTHKNIKRVISFNNIQTLFWRNA